MTDTAEHTAAPTESLVSTRWIRGPISDLLLAFAWAPVFVTARVLDADRLDDLTVLVLLVSFCHQPVTLPLVYGDARERRRLAAFLLVAPPAAVAFVYAGLEISLVLVGVVSGLWNADHTLRQRYGLVRVYGRKVDQADGSHEQSLLFSWFAVTLAVCLSGDALIDRLQGLPVGFLNREIVDLLEVVQPGAPIAALVATIWALSATGRWVRLERSRPRNRAKHLYLLGAGTAFAVAPFDPVAAFLGFMSAHSLEYLTVVAGTVRRRVPARSLVGRIVAVPTGPVLFLGAYVAGILGLVAIVRGVLPTQLFVAMYLSIGVLHFVFDGMIWKLRRPELAETFGLPDPAA